MGRIIDGRLFHIIVIVCTLFFCGIGYYTAWGELMSDTSSKVVYWIIDRSMIFSVLLLLRCFILEKRVKVLLLGVAGLYFMLAACQILHILGFIINEYIWGSFVYIFLIFVIILYRYGKR